MMVMTTHPDHDDAFDLDLDPDQAPDADADIDLGVVVDIGTALERWEDRAPVGPRTGERAGSMTDAAHACMTRFAAVEGDVGDPGLIGIGRQSAVRSPRLGGVLHGRVAAGSDAAALVVAGVHRTIRAGYDVALATRQVADVAVRHAEPEDLWDAFVPASYRIPRELAATTWDVCRFDRFWTTLLLDIGLEGDAGRFARGRVSPLSRSLRGLSTVGVALALAERGGRHERRTAARWGARTQRAERFGLPPAPRPLGEG